MKEYDIKQLVADTGRLLLDKGLVARTWGNISCRVDDTHFAISPSGLGYENMQAEDVPIYDFVNETYEGTRKPSSEKKVHAAAYINYPDVNFVVHTHQDFATAVSLIGTDKLDMSEEEKDLLGSIEIAGYGLPGTKKLKKNVDEALKRGSKVVLMIHHGAVILGKDKDDAIAKVEMLEAVCKRAVIKVIDDGSHSQEALAEGVLEALPGAVLAVDDNILSVADEGGIPSQLDDIAQMTGIRVNAVKNDKSVIIKALAKSPAVLVKGVGCIIHASEEDDAKALDILIRKAAMSYRLTNALNIKIGLSVFDCILMKAVYKMKYSKQKKG